MASVADGQGQPDRLEDSKSERVLRVALLHLAPRPGDLAYNRQAITDGVERAAALGADWVLTPELAVSGYAFANAIGVGWIEPQPDAWTNELARQAARLHMSIFLGTPERDAGSGCLYNSVLIIGADGSILGRRRKVHVVPVPAEAWATPGEQEGPISVDGIPAGILICADSYTPALAGRLREQGAALLLSPVAWPPGEHGPEGVWEARSEETGLALLVCNRTGEEPILSFLQGDSVLAWAGQRALQFRSPQPCILIADLDRATLAPISSRFGVYAFHSHY